MTDGWSLVRAGELLYSDTVGKDACGIGGVAAAGGVPSFEVTRKAVNALVAMEHRGGVCGDLGDGAGLTCQLPQAFFREQAKRLGFRPGDRPLAVGAVFVGEREPGRADAVRAILRDALSGGPVTLLGVRPVPLNRDVVPPAAQATFPGSIEQWLLSRGRRPGRGRAVPVRRPAGDPPPARRGRAGGLRVQPVGPYGQLQGAAHQPAVRRLLPRPVGPGVRDRHRLVPPPVQHQHPAQLDPRPAVPAALPQRRDQHRPDQPQRRPRLQPGHDPAAPRRRPAHPADVRLGQSGRVGGTPAPGPRLEPAAGHAAERAAGVGHRGRRVGPAGLRPVHLLPPHLRRAGRLGRPGRPDRHRRPGAGRPGGPHGPAAGAVVRRQAGLAVHRQRERGVRPGPAGHRRQRPVAARPDDRPGHRDGGTAGQPRHHGPGGGRVEGRPRRPAGAEPPADRADRGVRLQPADRGHRRGHAGRAGLDAGSPAASRRLGLRAGTVRQGHGQAGQGAAEQHGPRPGADGVQPAPPDAVQVPATDLRRGDEPAHRPVPRGRCHVAGHLPG